jgi:hypothetical protein
MSIIEDIQRRSGHIHWPQGIVPEQADLFAHDDIVIAAPVPCQIPRRAREAGPRRPRPRSGVPTHSTHRRARNHGTTDPAPTATSLFPGVDLI